MKKVKRGFAFWEAIVMMITMSILCYLGYLYKGENKVPEVKSYFKVIADEYIVGCNCVVIEVEGHRFFSIRSSNGVSMIELKQEQKENVSNKEAEKQ